MNVERYPTWYLSHLLRVHEQDLSVEINICILCRDGSTEIYFHPQPKGTFNPCELALL